LDEVVYWLFRNIVDRHVLKSTKRV
jgi:hypothetical protein